MEYGEYKEIQKRMKTARKFLRISNTMMRDIKHELSGNGIVCLGINNESLSEVINSLDNYIKAYSATYVLHGGQLNLFND